MTDLAGFLRALTSLVVLLIALALPACSREEWTREEVQNAGYILLAFREEQEATRIGNGGGALTALSASDFEMMRSHLKKAYDYALLVEDGVLDKAHRELRQHWKEENVEGLRLCLVNFDRGDATAEIEGQRLLDKFGDWWNAHKGEIRIPNEGS
jgi:hypothetical protein